MDRRLITTDCHISLPYGLVDQLPEQYREHFARVEKRADGDYLIHPQMSQMSAMAGDAATTGFKLGDDPDALARNSWGNVVPEAHPSYDPAALLADLESDGVYGAVLIGDFDGFGDVPLDAEIAYCEIVNDYLADAWGPYLDRVAPGIHLPYRDVAASVKELERAAAKGLRPALMPVGLYDRPYHLAEWEPLWEAASSLNVPFTMHVGSGSQTPAGPSGVMEAMQNPWPGLADVGFYTASCMLGDTLGRLAFGGVFQKYPDLHVVMTEGYAGWLAFAMQMFDHHKHQSRFATVSALMGEAVKLEAPPSYYLKRQAHATFMWDPLAIRSRDLTGLDCLLWGNDYPHHEGSFGFSNEWIDKQFAGVPEKEVDQIVRGNAARLFGITV